jgi:hypothetical protein
MFDPSRQPPNFFLLGAMRAGTASMTTYLAQHPAICFTLPRNPYFFKKTELYQQGINYYYRQFCRNPSGDDWSKSLWRGEASSTYFAHPHIVGPRLRMYFGDSPLKFIVLLREPVARAWSHYLFAFHHGYETRSFATALEQEAHQVPGSPFGYYAGGCYAKLLKEWQNYYPPENFLLLLSEDLAAVPLTQTQRVFEWLGVDTTVPINVSMRLNTASYSLNPQVNHFLNQPPALLSAIGKRLWPTSWLRQRVRNRLHESILTPYAAIPPLDPVIEAELRRRYTSDVLELSQVLGRYFSHWLPVHENALELSPQNL